VFVRATVCPSAKSTVPEMVKTAPGLVAAGVGTAIGVCVGAEVGAAVRADVGATV